MKKFLALAALMVTATLSYGYSLKWDVDVSEIEGSENYNYAYLVAVKDGSQQYYMGGGFAIDSDGTLAGGPLPTELSREMFEYDNSTGSWGAVAGATDFSGYSFHILFTSDQSGSKDSQLLSTQGMSDYDKSWGELVSGGFTSMMTPGGAMPLSGVWTVPEPSCALLFGLGAALVAVRRRRR